MSDQKRVKKWFHMLQLLEARLVLKRIYLDIDQVSGICWQKFSPAIDHWNGVIECFAILQSIVSLMLSKKGTCLSKDCEYKKVKFWRDV